MTSWSKRLARKKAAATLVVKAGDESFAKPGERIAFTDNGSCPACGLGIFTTSAHGGGMGHAEPMCETFERLDALEFIRFVNEKRGNYHKQN